MKWDAWFAKQNKNLSKIPKKDRIILALSFHVLPAHEPVHKSIRKAFFDSALGQECSKALAAHAKAKAKDLGTELLFRIVSLKDAEVKALTLGKTIAAIPKGRDWISFSSDVAYLKRELYHHNSNVYFKEKHDLIIFKSGLKAFPLVELADDVRNWKFSEETANILLSIGTNIGGTKGKNFEDAFLGPVENLDYDLYDPRRYEGSYRQTITLLYHEKEYFVVDPKVTFNRSNVSQFLKGGVKTLWPEMEKG